VQVEQDAVERSRRAQVGQQICGALPRGADDVDPAEAPLVCGVPVRQGPPRDLVRTRPAGEAAAASEGTRVTPRAAAPSIIPPRQVPVSR